jgi:hypothetical protein
MAQTDGATIGARPAVKFLLDHDVPEDLAYLLPIELTERHPHHGLTSSSDEERAAELAALFPLLDRSRKRLQGNVNFA